MRKPVWLLPEVVYATHEKLLAEFGGATGVRDENLLASALARPRNVSAYAQPTIFEPASAYAFGVVKNHPFVDGNKRTGFTIAVMFLEINGLTFDASEADATIQTLALAAGELTEERYAEWLKAHSRKRRKS